MLLKFKNSATQWVSLYADAIKNRLRRDLNLADVTNKAACRKNLELVGEVPDHYHDNRYLPLIAKSKDDLKSLVDNLSISLIGDVTGAATKTSNQGTVTIPTGNVTATKTKLSATTSGSSMNLPLVMGNGIQELLTSSNLKYVPSTGTLSTSILTSNSIESGIINANKVYNSLWNDYAEFFPRGEETEPGDIVMLDKKSDKEQYVKAYAGSDNCIVGVHSDEYATLIGGEKPPKGTDYFEYNIKDYIPVGLAGRIYVKFVGEARKGKQVVPSEIPGYGRLYNPAIDSRDSIIGYLVESDKNTNKRKLRIKIK